MTEVILQWTLKMILEVQKHAERDDCYSCKQLLKAPNVKPLLELPALERVKAYLERAENKGKVLEAHKE
jgi:hypothetical protein